MYPPLYDPSDNLVKLIDSGDLNKFKSELVKISERLSPYNLTGELKDSESRNLEIKSINNSLIYLAKNPSINKRTKFIEALLIYSVTNLNSVFLEKTDSGEKKFVSALHTAIEQKDKDLFELLLKDKTLKLVEETENAKGAKTLADIGRMPNFLHTAIYSDNPAFAKLLIGRDPRILQLYPDNLLEDIFEKAKINETSNLSEGKDTPEYDYAPEWKDLIQTVVTVLEQNNKNERFSLILNKLLSNFFSNPRLKTFNLKDNLLITTLIDCKDFNINGLFEKGFSTLMMKAAEIDRTDLLSLFKERGAKPNEVNEQGQTVMHYVKSAKAAELVGTPENTDLLDNFSYSPLRDALRQKKPPELIMYFLNKEANLFFKDSGNNILHFLANYRSWTTPEEIKTIGFTYEYFVERVFEKISASNFTAKDFLKQKWSIFGRSGRILTPLQNSFDLYNKDLVDILLRKENELGLTSLAKEPAMLYILRSMGKTLFILALSNISSQEKSSKNLVPIEVLLELAENWDNYLNIGLYSDPSHYLSSVTLKVTKKSYLEELAQIIEKFYPNDKGRYLKIVNAIGEKSQKSAEDLEQNPKPLINGEHSQTSDVIQNQMLGNNNNDLAKESSIMENDPSKGAGNIENRTNQPISQANSTSDPSSNASPSSAQVAKNTSEPATNSYFSRFVAWVKAIWHRVRDFFTGDINPTQENKTDLSNNTEINVPNTPSHAQNQTQGQNQQSPRRNS